MGVPFVGRRAELAQLHDAWRSARAGDARVVVVVAGSGVGKTALIEQFLREAVPERHVWVSSEPIERELSWHVLRQVAAGLSAWTGRTARWAERDPQGNPAHAGLPFLDELKNAGPVVLVLDDAQWADWQSQAVLRFAARHMRGLPALMIVAYNDESPADDGWRRIFPAAPGNLLELAGLGPEDLVQLAVQLGRIGLSPAGAARLREHTDGNPLFAGEVLRQVAVRDINAGQGPLPAPRTVSGAVAAKLAACSGSARTLAAAAAVLGGEFDVAQASALAGLADASGFVDELVTAGLVTAAPATASRRFRFSHALAHQAVYDQAAFAHRRELHRRAAAMLSGSAALRHRVAAADGPDPVLAADLDRRADSEAVRGEFAAAASYRREALARTPPGPDRVRRLLSVVEAELIAGDATAAADHAEELAAGGPGPWWDYVTGYQLTLGGQIGEARLRLGRALGAAGADTGAATPGAPADLRARIATLLAVIAMVSLSYRDMVEYGRIAVTAPTADPRVRVFAWFARTLGLTLTGHGVQALDELGARRPGRDLDLLAAQGIAELWTDDLGAALAHLGEAVNRAYQGEPLRVGQALAFLGDAEYRRGMVEEAVLHTERAVWEAEESSRVWDYALLHGFACQARAARGDFAEARAHAEAAERSAALWASVSGTRASLLSAAGARAVIAQALGDAPGLLAAAGDVEAVLDAPEPGITILGPLRAEALVQLGDADAAESALADYCARFAAAGRKSTLMSIARVRGRIAAARGDHAGALAGYSSALRLADSVGLPLEAGRIEMLMGECLAASGRALGAGLRLRAALRCFTRIGARAYAAQAAGLIRGHGLPLDDPADVLAGLTPSQREVVAGVGAGLSTPEIAERLVISASGVEQHLTRVYRELGLAGRDKREALRRLLNGVG